MKRSFGLKPSNIPSKEYDFYDIPNVDDVKLAVYKHKTYRYILLCGYDKRGLWFALGDRADLVPNELKDLGLLSVREGSLKEEKEFIKKVIEKFG